MTFPFRNGWRPVALPSGWHRLFSLCRRKRLCHRPTQATTARIEHRALTARHNSKWRAVERTLQFRRFRAGTPTARHLENWQPVAQSPGNHAGFGLDPALWRAVVGRSSSILAGKLGRVARPPALGCFPSAPLRALKRVIPRRVSPRMRVYTILHYPHKMASAGLAVLLTCVPDAGGE
jgi:hypothetical protein